MNRHVNAISGRLSLRPPQRRSLEILDRITEIVPPSKSPVVTEALELIQSEYPSVTDFERDFPSLCFALATGVGKTRLMGAFVTYLHIAQGINNFFVLAPNLTIYNKLIADFTPNTPKDVFKGIAEFAQEAPEIVTGDDYEAKAGTLFDLVLRRIRVLTRLKVVDAYASKFICAIRGIGGSLQTERRRRPATTSRNVAGFPSKREPSSRHGKVWDNIGAVSSRDKNRAFALYRGKVPAGRIRIASDNGHPVPACLDVRAKETLSLK